MASRTFSVKITGDAKDLKRAFGDASSAAQRFDQNLVNFGKKGALALAGVAAASTKLASDFENSMSKMVGLVGLADGEVEGFRDSILALSGETARAPQELADAMFFITSAGLRGSAALEALEVSAKGAAAGLGNTQDIAFAAVSAVNAYGAENLNASQAVDILTNTIRQGNVEASQVAGVLGNIIPVAAEMGIGFDQVGASLAAMTRLGSDAASSATSLQAIMSTLLKPTAEAERALAGVGLSAAGLREQISNEGLMPVLFQLRDAFIGNDEAIAQVFGNVRALRGVMNLAGENADTTRQIFDDLADSTGTLGEAFGAVADDEGFKLQQAFNDLKIIGVEVGEDILPQIAGALEANREPIKDVAEGIGDMSVALIDLAVAAEPILGFLPDMTDGLGVVLNSAVNVGAGFAAAGLEVISFGQANTEALQATADNAAASNDLWNALRNVEKWMQDGRDASSSYKDAIAALAEEGTITERALGRVADATEITEEAQADALESLIDWSRENGVASEQIRLLQETLSELRGELREVTPEQEELGDKIAQTAAQARGGVPDVDAYGNAIGGIGEGAEGIDAVTTAIKAQQDEIRKAIDPVFRFRDAQDKATEAQEAWQKAVDDNAPLEEQNDLAADAADAQADLEFAFDLVNGKLSEGITLIEGYGERAGISADAIARLREETVKLAAAMRTLPSVGEARALDVDDPNRIRILKEELERRARGEVGG